MSKIILPAGYTPALNLYDTQRAIGTVKRLFADTLCATLNLRRVSAPLFVEAASGLNDDLNGVERKVSFDIKDTGVTAEVVQSLAKWKRKALKDYDFHVGKGLYCDMNAITPSAGTRNWTTSTRSMSISGTGRRSFGRRTATSTTSRGWCGASSRRSAPPR